MPKASQLRVLHIVYHLLVHIPSFRGQFIHFIPLFNIGQHLLAILYSRKRVDRKEKREVAKDIKEFGALNKGLWSTLSTFIPRLMITPMSLKMAYFINSLTSGVDGTAAEQDDNTDYESEAGQQWLLQQHTVECGCCFDTYPLDKMVQCPEAHLFCKSCMFVYASNLLGEHNHNIACMDQSGCTLHFPQSQLEQFLTPTLLDLYHRVRQRKEIEAAHLENLEECPFCDYKCIIEDKREKCFQCRNESCGVVSCRKCKQSDHFPKTCKESEADKQLDAQHIIEEAMSRALIRNCPKCQKAFVKERFCNKMTCPNCHTLSCYVCRKVIDGYDHFSADNSQCKLWDEVEKRHASEVEAAAKKAMEELRRDGKIKVDVRNRIHPRRFRLFLGKIRIRKTVTA